MLKIGSLCTGYGGLDMAVEAADTYSYAREKPRRADREVRAESVGLRRRTNEGQTGAKFRFSLKMDEERVPAALDKGRLNVKFVEYMMGLPDGWVSDVDISRAHKLKILGNGVVPQQAYRALELLVATPSDLLLC